jgi:hypothetical protein
MPDNKAAQDRLDFGDTAVLSIWRELAHKETSTCGKENLCIHQRSTSCTPTAHHTHRKQHEEDVLDNPLASSIANPHGASPFLPVCTLVTSVDSPAAKPFVQVEPPISLYATAVPRLEVGQPVARNIDEGSNSSTQDACRDEDDPYLTGICELLDCAQQTCCAGVQVAQALPFLGVLEDPVDGCQIIVADAPTRPFDVPVQARGVFGVDQVGACVAGCVEIVEDELRGAIAVVGVGCGPRAT